MNKSLQNHETPSGRFAAGVHSPLEQSLASKRNIEDLNIPKIDYL